MQCKYACIFPLSLHHALDFVSSPQSATVEIGSSVSFSCVVFNSSVSHWYINNMTVRTMMSSNNYSEWDGCTRDPQYCGRTLFIEYVSKELNESTISCQVLHKTCNGYNATLSEPAILIGKFQPNDAMKDYNDNDTSILDFSEIARLGDWVIILQQYSPSAFSHSITETLLLSIPHSHPFSTTSGLLRYSLPQRIPARYV